MKKAAILASIVFLLACTSRPVFGMGGEIPAGQAINQHADWPEGMADVLNKSKRVGGFWEDCWVSDGLISASEHYYYQGDSNAFNAFLEGMAKLKGAPVTVVMLEGRGKATGWWAKDPDKGPDADWMISIVPTGGGPKDKPGCVMVVNAWLGGQIGADEYNVKIPPGMKAIYASKIKLSIRCAAKDVKVGDKIPVEFTVTNGGESELDYVDYGESAEYGNGMWLEAKTREVLVPAWPNIGDLVGTSPRGMQLAPGKSFTTTRVPNRIAFVNAPGRFVVTGSYSLPGGFGVAVSKPITVEVGPRTPAEMTAHVNGLIARLEAFKGEEGRVSLMRQLTYTGDMRVMPALIDSMYKTKAAFCKELWFNPYLADQAEKAEIERQVVSAATKRGLASGMAFFLGGAKIGAVEMYPLIERSLAEDNPGCWEEGCGAAQSFRDTRFVPRLIAIAGAADTNANKTAMWALVANRTDDGVAALRKILNGPDERLKKLAAEVVRGTNADVRELIKGLGDPDAKKRAEAAIALGHMAESYRDKEFLTEMGEAVPALVRGVGDAEVNVREACVIALGKIGPVTKEVVPALMQALGDAKYAVRRRAAEAFQSIGPEAKDAVPALVKALGDPEVWVRCEAVQALGKIGPGAKDAVPALIKALSDADVNVPFRAAKALGLIGPGAKEAIPELERLTEQTPNAGNEWAIRDAREALEKIRK